MRIAVAQIKTGADPQVNLEKVERFVRRAAESGARLVVFPEATLRAFDSGRLDEVADDDAGFTAGVRELADGLGLTAVIGTFRPADTVFEKREYRRVFNTAAAVGRTEAVYDKIHTYDAAGYRESLTVRPGSRVVTATVDAASVGFAVCFDVRFPELFRELACRGAELIVLPASWAGGPGKVDEWRLLVRARAVDTGCFIIAADQAADGDPERAGGPTGVGHSLVAGPDGRVVAEAGAGEELLVVDVDPGEVAERRARMPVLPR